MIRRISRTKLHVSTGLTLRRLQENSSDTDTLNNYLVLLKHCNSNKIYKVAIRNDINNGNGDSSTSLEDLVYVEYKTYNTPLSRNRNTHTPMWFRGTPSPAKRLICRIPDTSSPLHDEKPSKSKFAFVFDLPTGVDPKAITLLHVFGHNNTDEGQSL